MADPVRSLKGKLIILLARSVLPSLVTARYETGLDQFLKVFK